MEYRSELLSSFGTAFQIYKELTDAVMAKGGTDGDIKKILTIPALRAKLADDILGKQETIVQATTPQPLVTKLTIVSGFDRDMRNESWKLLEDTGEPVEFDASRLELVSFLQTDEPYAGGETMLKRARGKEPVKGQMLVGCNWGQRHGEALLRNQHLIPVEWRGKVIVLPGTVWQDGSRDRFVACLVFRGERWVLDFYWLGHFGSDYQLLRLRELPLAA